MNRSRRCLGAAAFLLLCPFVAGQEPTPFAPPSPAAVLVPPGQVPPPVPGPAGGLVPLQPPPGPFAQPVSPREANAGFLFGLELAIITPHLGGSLAGGALDTTLEPTFLIGYRFLSGRSVQLEYRYFGANGDQTAFLAGDPAPITIHRHVEANIFDLDVRFLQNQWPLLFRSQWELGARVANISTLAYRPSPTFLSLVSNRFQGAGPLIDWRLSWAVFDTGLELFGRSDIAALFGHNQGFSQQNPGAGIPAGPVVHMSDGKVTWNGRFQLGAGYWFDWGRSRLQIAGGYELDAFYINGAGELNPAASGVGSLFGQVKQGGARLVNKGPFLDVEFKY
jgi:hypothetical protein